METWSTRRERKIPRRKPDVEVESCRVVNSDILSDIMPMYHISKICGLLPVRFTLKKPGRYIGRVDYPQVVYGILLLLGLAGLQCYGVYLDARDGLENSTRLASKSLIIVTFGDVAGSIGVVAVIMLNSPCRWRSLQRALDKLVHVDEKLGASVTTPSSLRKLLVSLVTVTLACLIVISTADFFSWGLSADDDDSDIYGDKGPLTYAPLYLLYLVTIVCELQYAAMVLSVGERFRKLNHVIENISNKNDAAVDFSNLGDNVQVEALDQLITLYGVLFDSVGCLNEAYGVAIVMVTMSCVINLLITEYFLYNYVYSPEPNSWPLLILQFFWILFHFSRMLLIVQPCHTVTVKAKRTGALVNQASTSDLSAEVKKQLRIFSIKVLHRPIEFSACGLFYLNRGLLTSVVGSVTTYLVILVQFQTSSETEDAEDLVEKASELIRNVSSFKKYLFSIK